MAPRQKGEMPCLTGGRSAGTDDDGCTFLERGWRLWRKLIFSRLCLRKVLASLNGGVNASACRRGSFLVVAAVDLRPNFEASGTRAWESAGRLENFATNRSVIPHAAPLVRLEGVKTTPAIAPNSDVLRGGEAPVAVAVPLHPSATSLNST